MPDFDPYLSWLGIGPEERPPSHYRLLALVPFESRTERIEEASSVRGALLVPHLAGPQRELARRLLDEVEAARQCLLDPAMRAGYDAGLRAARGAPRPAAPTGAAPPVAIPLARPIMSGPVAQPVAPPTAQPAAPRAIVPPHLAPQRIASLEPPLPVPPHLATTRALPAEPTPPPVAPEPPAPPLPESPLAPPLPEQDTPPGILARWWWLLVALPLLAGAIATPWLLPHVREWFGWGPRRSTAELSNSAAQPTDTTLSPQAADDEPSPDDKEPSGPPVIRQGGDASLRLSPGSATLDGAVQLVSAEGAETLAEWGSPDDVARWRFQVVKGGVFRVRIRYNAAPEWAGAVYEVWIDDSEPKTVVVRASADEPLTDELFLAVPASGAHTFSFSPRSLAGGGVLRLLVVELTPPDAANEPRGGIFK